MRRDILRFPVGPQFWKILEDDHEWIVITDMRLKILSAKRGGEKSILNSVVKETIDEALQKYSQEAKHTRVYMLHSHPDWDKNPSPQDINAAFTDKLYSRFGVKSKNYAGFGIITKSGIYIYKLPENPKLWNLIDFGKKYNSSIDKHYAEYKKNNSLENLNNKEIDKLSNDLITKAFKKMVSKNPDIKTKKVRRTHRFNMWRRR